MLSKTTGGLSPQIDVWRGRDIERHQPADNSYMDEGIELLNLARDAYRLFEKQSPGEKSRMLSLPVSNCSRANGELTVDFKHPF